jgi:predicted  nucleic acid-binding Zn-ribbon protein
MTQAVLARLQLLDTELDGLRKQASEIEKLIADRAPLEAALAGARDAAEGAAESRARQRDRELELSTLDTRISELDKRLYSGRIHNTKELESLSNEAQMFKENKRKLEETVLALMDQTEQAEAAAEAARRIAEAAQVDRLRTESTWQGQLLDLRTAIADLEGRTAELRSAVLPDHLETYDRMRRRNGLVVVRVRGESCGACGVALSSRVLEQARDDEKLPTCDNCGRVLQSD